jgi:hypothetical protein
MGIAAYNRGSKVLSRPFEESLEDARVSEEAMRLLIAAERAVEYCREVNGLIAEMRHAKGIRGPHQRAYLDCNIGRNRFGKYLAACAAWREACGQRTVAFRALEMREAAKRLLAWIPGASIPRESSVT